MPKIPEKLETLQPFWQTTDGATAVLYLGNVVNVLRKMRAKSVQCIVTSPPYWGLRDYKTGSWEGGDPECDHTRVNTQAGTEKSTLGGGKSTNGHQQEPWSKGVCGKCGANRVDMQIGSEPSPDCGTHGKAQCGRCFICTMVAVFTEARRVLRDDGTCWLNLGDTYASRTDGSNGGIGDRLDELNNKTRNKSRLDVSVGDFKPKSGLVSGNLVGIPWRVALALQQNGWVLRQDIVWSKPSPMPESVRNRCTKAHEYVFLLTKTGSGYYCDMEALKTDAEPAERIISGKSGSYGQAIASGRTPSGNGKPGSVMKTGNLANKRTVWEIEPQDTFLDWLYEQYPETVAQFRSEYLEAVRNKSDVWRIASFGYPGAHFATYPPKLIEPCILAGTSEYGCCEACGAPYKRVTETVAGVSTKTLGWEPSCECYGSFEKRKGVRLGYGAYHDHAQDGVAYGLRQDGKGPASDPGAPTKEFETTLTRYVSDLPLDNHPVVPCTVLDIFIGSGTTIDVAIQHGRNGIGIDLSEQYLRSNAIPRIEGSLWAKKFGYLTGRKREKLEGGEELT